MQTSKPYNRGHADALLAPCGEVSPWRIDDRGVWPAYSDYEEAKRLGLESEQKLLSWKPVMVFQDDQNAPDCKDTPALPFPFDARDLAAFMLDGVGAFVADYYGDWEDGPETESLNDIDPSNNYARRAVREAFDAYRQAVKSVGEPDNADTWRDAMVRELLTPKVEPEPAVVGAAPAQPQTAQPAPVVAESASNAPAWTVRKPKRYRGYAAPLHRLLVAAQRDGNLCPTARDVVAAWRNNAPAEIAKVLPDGFDYYDANGNTKTAGIDAIRNAIKRMTSAR